MIDDALTPGRDASPADIRRIVAVVARSRALTGVLSEEGVPIYLSPEALALHTGLRSDNVAELGLAVERIHPDDFAILAESFGESLARPEEPVPARYRTLHEDGSWRILEGTYTNLLSDPDIGGIVMDVVDVTDRAAAEDALRASEARNRRVVDSLAEGIILSDGGGRIVACNPAAETLLGLGSEQIMEHTSQDPRWTLIRRDGSIIEPDDRPATKTRATGESCRDVVMGVPRPDGDTTWLSANSVVIESDADRPARARRGVAH